MRHKVAIMEAGSILDVPSLIPLTNATVSVSPRLKWLITKSNRLYSTAQQMQRDDYRHQIVSRCPPKLGWICPQRSNVYSQLQCPFKGMFQNKSYLPATVCIEERARPMLTVHLALPGINREFGLYVKGLRVGERNVLKGQLYPKIRIVFQSYTSFPSF